MVFATKTVHSMKDRIRKVMESQNMTQQEFADFVHISPASLSSVFTGRTRPTLAIVEAIKGALPDISTDWLMFGSGNMWLSENTYYNNVSAGNEQGETEGGSSVSPPPIVIWEGGRRRCSISVGRSLLVLLRLHLPLMVRICHNQAFLIFGL